MPGLSVLRTMRLTRVFRVFKVGKYSASVKLLHRVMNTSMEALYLMLFFVMLGMVIFGTVIFYCEVGEYDEATGEYLRPTVDGTGMEPSPFVSIFQGFYWVIVTAVRTACGSVRRSGYAVTSAAVVFTDHRWFW